MKRRVFVHSALAVAASSIVPGKLIVAANSLQSETLPIITQFGQEASIPASLVKEFQASLRGVLLLAEDPDYDQARAVWNAMIDKSPALIVRCEGPADVVSAMNFARENRLRVAVRGGGHSISGKSVCEGGLMIDMSAMNTVRVDVAKSTARADGGCLEGHIDREAALFGMATTGGIVSHTGAAGLTLGGGYGRLCRKFGMACDNLLGADIVTTDGKFRHVSSSENPDLLWALKGGGGNFGIVTALEYQLYPQQTDVIAGDVVFDWKDAASVLSFYAEQGNEMPDELNMNLTLLTSTEGDRRVAVEAVWAGEHGAAEPVLNRLRRAGRPIADTVSRVPYAQFQRRGDNSNRHGVRQYMKSSMVNEFSDALVEDLVKIYRPNPISKFFFMQAGGAVSRVSPTATAYPHRAAHSNMMRWNAWFDLETDLQRQERIADVKADWAVMEPYTQGFYVNLNDEGDERTRANYGANYARLQVAKKKYDPTNLLRLNANILPV